MMSTVAEFGAGMHVQVLFGWLNVLERLSV